MLRVKPELHVVPFSVVRLARLQRHTEEARVVAGLYVGASPERRARSKYSERPVSSWMRRTSKVEKPLHSPELAQCHSPPIISATSSRCSSQGLVLNTSTSKRVQRIPGKIFSVVFEGMAERAGKWGFNFRWITSTLENLQFGFFCDTSPETYPTHFIPECTRALCRG